ncbi:hypothetical protein [Marinobacter gelidimuriae]|uniref:hypothetical protein n=1 Tax=Marinobacter gelidimuriae TaxID=2739064 RepID=UPI000362DEEF|nr:hypothetical protein [Marinobacter gelidimuriae]
MTTYRISDPLPPPAIILNRRFLLALLVFTLALAAGASWAGYTLAVAKIEAETPASAELVVRWQARLQEQKAELAQIETDVQHQVDAITLRLGAMQGRLLRLDALGQRFVESGLVNNEEFDFSAPAPVGGPGRSLRKPVTQM